MVPPFQNAVTRAGRDAALVVARRLGLPTGDPRVLSARGNLVLHLAPAPVVARVPTGTAWTRADPGAWAAREVAVTGHAAAAGADVLAPWTDPGPHAVEVPGGSVVSLWWHAPVLDRRPTPSSVGTALAALHAVLATYPDPLPWLTPVHEQVTDALAAVARRGLLDAVDLADLHRVHDAAVTGIAAHDGPVGVLHGDAHAGNLVGVPGPDGVRWCWSDLEETCRGPLAWDLAVLAASTGPVGAHGARGALSAWATAAGTDVPDPAALAPFTAARRVEAAVWLAAMAEVYPDRYARLVGPAVAAAVAGVR